MIRLRLCIEYDGTAFNGWARQPHLRTVAGELEDAFAHILHPLRPRLYAAGRTDTGVHARGQVAHVDIPQDLWRSRGLNAERLLQKLRRALHVGDINVKSAAEVPLDFDARFSANFRQYRYYFTNSIHQLTPFNRLYTGYIDCAFDVKKARKAAKMMLGIHDFGAFCKKRTGATTIRHLLEFSWKRSAGIYTATVRADAFCHSMVRNIVGACVWAACGRLDLRAIGEMLRFGSRSIPQEGTVADSGGKPFRTAYFPTMPASGLFLDYVDYPPLSECGTRVRQTKNVRDPGEINT